MPQSAALITDPSPTPLPGDISPMPSCQGLLEVLLAVPDGRSDQGRDPVALVLLARPRSLIEGLHRDQRLGH